MKKSIIAASAASLAVAAMPIVGVFAADPAQVVDTVRVKVDESCTFEATQDGATVTPTGTPLTIARTFEKTTTLGTVVELGGSANAGVPTGQNSIAITATCNSGDSGSAKTGNWTISATSTGTMAGTSSSIPNATTGNEALTSGATSAWSMKIEAATGATIATGFNNWHVMPTSATPVVTGTASTSTDVDFKPAYRVYVGTDQAADTYTGTVTYTISSTWN